MCRFIITSREQKEQHLDICTALYECQLNDVTTCNAEDGEGRRGTFIFDETALPASLKDLPTIVECYKTYDDVNLVKTGDIGQVVCQHQLPVTIILHAKTQHITTVADAILLRLLSKLCKVWQAHRRSQTLSDTCICR